MRGNGKYNMYTFIQQRDESLHIGKTTKYPIKFGFESIEEATNFFNYLKTDFAKFALSLYKINRNVHQGEMKSVPWLDFSRSWTNEECEEFADFTEEEKKWYRNWLLE